MSAVHEVVNRHVEALLDEAEAQQLPADTVARALLNKVIEIYRRQRSIEDVRSELEFVAETLDDDTDFAFMRPSG